MLDPVQRGVERREAERARIDVGRDDALRVPRGEERLDPAAGAEVERAGARPPDRELRERDRRRLDPRDVVVRDLAAALGPAVGRDDVVAVRDEPHARPRRPAVERDEPERREPFGREPGRVREPLRRHVGPEEEQACEGREAVVALEPAQVRRGVGRTRRELAGAEPLLDPLGREARPVERRPERPQRVPVGAVRHVGAHRAIVVLKRSATRADSRSDGDDHLEPPPRSAGARPRTCCASTSASASPR